MFFVADSQEYKKKYILKYLIKEPMIAVLLAAANFEWTVGRCIFIFSTLPNKLLRERLSRCHGLGSYKKLWKEAIIETDGSIPPLAEITGHWEEFSEAFLLRHRLIHARATCTRNMAQKPIEIMLSVTDKLYSFANSRGKNLNARLPIRRKVDR